MQAVPGEQPSQFDGEDDDHNLIQGEWRQNANMHEIRNMDALARTARMGSISVNSTLTAPLAPCHGRTRWCLVETKVKDPGNNVSIATSTYTPSAPCTTTTTSWMLPSLNDGYHLAHTFNN